MLHGLWEEQRAGLYRFRIHTLLARWPPHSARCLSPDFGARSAKWRAQSRAQSRVQSAECSAESRVQSAACGASSETVSTSVLSKCQCNNGMSKCQCNNGTHRGADQRYDVGGERQEVNQRACDGRKACERTAERRRKTANAQQNDGERLLLHRWPGRAPKSLRAAQTRSPATPVCAATCVCEQMCVCV